MKTTKSIVILLLVLLTAQIASAYYCPSTGRWLSHDPMGEPGFETIRAASAVPKVGQVISPVSLLPGHRVERDPIAESKQANLYHFVHNNPITRMDYLGLRDPIFGAGKLCVDKNCNASSLSSLRYIPEDPPVLLVSLPAPGNCVDVDAFYFPGGGWKISDNAKVTIKCNKCGGLDSFSYSRWPWWVGSRSEWNVGGTKPTDWPGNIPPYSSQP